jgi:hypothetical protein
VRHFPKNTEHTVLGMIDDLDDTPAMADAVIFINLVNSQEDAIANTGSFPRPCVARLMNADFRGRAMGGLVPLVRDCNEFPVAIAHRDIGEHRRGEGAGMMQLLVPLFDGALIGEFAQNALEVGAERILQPESARDLAGADFAGPIADEGENVSLRWKERSFLSVFLQNNSPAPGKKI